MIQTVKCIISNSLESSRISLDKITNYKKNLTQEQITKYLRGRQHRMQNMQVTRVVDVACKQ